MTPRKGFTLAAGEEKLGVGRGVPSIDISCDVRILILYSYKKPTASPFPFLGLKSGKGR